MIDTNKIDVHTHVVPPFWGEQLATHGGDPSGWALPAWSAGDHLRYMDDAISTARLRDRQVFIAGKTGTPAGASSSTWAQGTAGFERLRAMTPEAERAEITASPLDPHRVGRRLRITGLHEKTHAVLQRLKIEQITG